MVTNVQSNGGIYSTEYADDDESSIIDDAKSFLRVLTMIPTIVLRL